MNKCVYIIWNDALSLAHLIPLEQNPEQEKEEVEEESK